MTQENVDDLSVGQCYKIDQDCNVIYRREHFSFFNSVCGDTNLRTGQKANNFGLVFPVETPSSEWIAKEQEDFKMWGRIAQVHHDVLTADIAD